MTRSLLLLPVQYTLHMRLPVPVLREAAAAAVNRSPSLSPSLNQNQKSPNQSPSLNQSPNQNLVSKAKAAVVTDVVEAAAAVEGHQVPVPVQYHLQTHFQLSRMMPNPPCLFPNHNLYPNQNLIASLLRSPKEDIRITGKEIVTTRKR